MKRPGDDGGHGGSSPSPHSAGMVGTMTTGGQTTRIEKTDTARPQVETAPLPATGDAAPTQAIATEAAAPASQDAATGRSGPEAIVSETMLSEATAPERPGPESPAAETAQPEISIPPAEAAHRRAVFRRRVLVAGVLAAGFSALAVLAGFLAFTTQIPTREPLLVKSADAIVVLTGGSSRITDAVALLAEGRGRRLLITGVNPTTSPGELRRALPDGEALISCCIDLGHKALNTRGNAIEAAEWTRAQNFRSLVVVTSSWHMPRALVELSRALPDVELVAYPVVTSRMEAERWWRDPMILKLLFKEYLKYVMAKVKIRPAQAVAVATPQPLAMARRPERGSAPKSMPEPTPFPAREDTTGSIPAARPKTRPDATAARTAP